jgi:hypothetical protein
MMMKPEIWTRGAEGMKIFIFKDHRIYEKIGFYDGI